MINALLVSRPSRLPMNHSECTMERGEVSGNCPPFNEVTSEGLTNWRADLIRATGKTMGSYL